jgi:diguanylate cyclase (GGDEF)-like protein
LAAEGDPQVHDLAGAPSAEEDAARDALAAAASDRILVVEDSPTVARLVASKLEAAGYETTVAPDALTALASAQGDCPDLILCDVVMPGLDGYELTRRLREDPRTTSVSIIMLTGLGNVMEGLESGADDYIIKPFNDLELLARIKSVLRRNKQMRAISPLTALPGNVRIEEEIERRISLGLDFSVMYADIDNFKPYNDHYGFARGDDVLKATARVIQDAALAIEGPASFVGHIGGDDFIAVVDPDHSQPMAEQIVARFEATVKELYDPTDAERGYIEIENRMGVVQRFTTLSISIGIATTTTRKFTHYAEAVAVAAELKGFAKGKDGSTWAMDRRSN